MWPEWMSAVGSSPRELRAFHEFWVTHAPGGDQWDALEIPILFLTGSLNPGQTATAERMAGRLKHAQAKVMAGHGHHAERDAPDLVVATIVDFVTSGS